MAPTITITGQKSAFSWSKQVWKTAAATPEVELKRRNEELEREIRSGQEREDGLRKELERVKARLTVAEEAEEWLCEQIGELGAESAEHAREYQQRIRELERAKRIISTSFSFSSES